MALDGLVGDLAPREKGNIFSQIFGDSGGGNGNGNGNAPNVKTIISVVFSTAPKTFTGPAIYVTAGTPEFTSREMSFEPAPTTVDFQPQATGSSAQTTSQDSFPSSGSYSSSTTSSSLSITSSVQMPSMTPENIPTNTDAAASATATPTAGKGGMSGGAKAGLAFGIILCLGLVVAAVFFLYRRQKQKYDAHQRLDDEKAMMTRPNATPVFVEPEPVYTPRSSGPAPRLSLRPVTEFQPNLGGDRRSAAANGNHVQEYNNLGANTSAPSSAWERPGAHNVANDPANPFGNHAETLNVRPARDTTGSSVTLPSIQVIPNAPGTLTPNPSVPEINAADFPLPLSVPGSPKPSNVSVESLNQPPQRVLEQSRPSSGITGPEVAAAGAAALAVGAAAKKETPAQSAAALPGDSKVHRVQMDFVPSMDDELSIRTGQLVRIQHEYDDGWALVSYMDNSRSGVVPRTCLSKSPLKPRPQNAQSPSRPQMRGPPVAPSMQPPRPLTPGSGRNSPAPLGQMPRPLTPTGRGAQAPYAQSPRPASPYHGRPASPYGSRSSSPMGRPRASSNSTPYVAYNPTGQRSMSPGPYGAGGLKPTPRPDNMRRRSNSMSQLSQPRSSATSSVKASSPLNTMPARKPVGGGAGPATEGPAS